MLILESKLRGKGSQFALGDEAIRTVQFVRNKFLRFWVDGYGKSQYDLNKYCAVLAKRFLKFQAQKKGVTVVDVMATPRKLSEAYTSRTCTKCGHIHSGLGGHRVFRCPVCKHRLPRDGNGYVYSIS